MSEFIEVPNVYLLDESEVKRKVVDSDTKKEKVVNYKIDSTKLQQICDVNNKRFADTGDKIPLIVAHTDDKGEKKVVGYAKDLKVQDFFKTGRKAISATFEIMSKYADEVRQYPRRSVELFANSGKLDPVALLGGTTPERDLGLLQFSDDNKKIKFEMSGGMDLSTLGQSLATKTTVAGMDPLQMLLEKLEQTDIFVWAKEQMNKQKAIDAGMTKDLLPQEDSESESLLGEQEEDVEEKEPEKGKGSSEPTGSEEPSKGDKEKMEANEVNDFKVKLASYEESKLKLEAIVNEIKVENAALKLQLQNANRKDTLLKLKSEGLNLDVDQELEYTKTFNEDQFKAHCEHAKVCYQKAPIGEPKFNFQKDGVKEEGVLSADDAHKIALKAAEEKISFADALNKYKGKI